MYTSECALIVFTSTCEKVSMFLWLKWLSLRTFFPSLFKQ